MKKFFIVLLCVAIAVSISACSLNKSDIQNADALTEETPVADEINVNTVPAIEITDALGQEFSIEKPKRVVAMIGSFADIWCLAGGKDTLVACADDTWTSFSLDLDDNVVNIGGVKEPNLELILSSKPDLILASCNTTADMDLKDTFADAGITAIYFDIQNINDYLGMLKVCTELTGCEENFTKYGTDVKAEVDKAISRADGSAPTILCMRATGSGCSVKSSNGNLLGEMLYDLGCVNIADSEASLLEELSIEAIIAADPDFIFIVLQGSDPSRAEEALNSALLSNPAWNELRAVKEGRFYTLEHKLYNLKPNARWGEAYEKLAEILYP